MARPKFVEIRMGNKILKLRLDARGGAYNPLTRIYLTPSEVRKLVASGRARLV